MFEFKLDQMFVNEVVKFVEDNQGSFEQANTLLAVKFP